MIKITLLISVLSFLIVNGQTTAIPDSNFEKALIDLGYDDVIDGQVLTPNISSVSTLDVSLKNISSLSGIEDFSSLDYLKCFGNSLTSLDISENLNLNWVECWNNSISNLNIDGLTNLNHLDCSFNQLSIIDLTNNDAIEEIWCNNNNLNTLIYCNLVLILVAYLN